MELIERALIQFALCLLTFEVRCQTERLPEMLDQILQTQLISFGERRLIGQAV
ncbi:hypothetical protein D3C71_2070180 [compost metagenome]